MDDASTPSDSGTMAGLDASATADAAMGDGGGPGVDSGTPLFDAGPGGSCTYPEGAVEPMALGAVLWPYRWPSAIDGSGANHPLDLSEVTCTEDPNRDWSPFDVLVFISIPGW